MINYKQSGQKIRNQRQLLGLTQEAVAEKVNITPSFYSQIESGTRKAGINTFVSLAKVLCISLDYMLVDDSMELLKRDFDDIEYQIFYNLKDLSTNSKQFILDMIILMEKNLTGDI